MIANPNKRTRFFGPELFSTYEYVFDSYVQVTPENLRVDLGDITHTQRLYSKSKS